MKTNANKWAVLGLILTSMTAHGFEFGTPNTDQRMAAICQPCRSPQDILNNPNCQALQANVVAERTANAQSPLGGLQGGGHGGGAMMPPQMSPMPMQMPAPQPAMMQPQVPQNRQF